MPGEFYDQQFALVDADIRRMKKGDGRAYKIGKKRLAKIGQALEIDRILVAVSQAQILAQYIESFERLRPTFRHSYSYDMFCEALSVGRKAAVA